MGWIGWTVLVVVLLGAVGVISFRHALKTNAVAVLDRGDALFQGNASIRQVAAVQFGDDHAQKLEMFVPSGATTALPVPALPIIVFIHGGGWDSGNPHDYRFVARTLAPHGYAVVLAGYRLYPHARYPAMLEDGAAALRWVQDHAAAHGGDPSRVVVMGHSSGAYNAIMLALDKRWLAHEGIDANVLRGAIGLAGPYDFYPFDDAAAIHSFGQAADPQDTQPVSHIRADAPPLLLMSGADDTRVKPRNSITLAREMSAAGASTKAILLSGVNHEKIAMMLAQPFARDTRVLGSVLPFLARMMAPRNAAASAPVQPVQR